MGKLKYPVIDGKKQCGGCDLMLPLSSFRKARKHYMATCKTCLALWAKEYRQRPEVKRASREYQQEYMQVDENKWRANARMRGYTKTDKYKKRRNQNRRDWALEQKRKAVEYKGGKCVVCGYSKCFAAMDFHHKNPLEKDGYGTGALKQHWSFERNKKELDKCVLVCVRCHREIHVGETTL